MQKNSTSKDKFDYIKEYTNAGYTVFPVAGKVPLKKEWQNTPYDPFLSPHSISGNYGIALTDKDLIIDIDPRNYPAGRDSWKELRAHIDLNGINQTFVVQTGSGGFHIYLKKSSDIKIRKTIEAYKGLDFLTKGCFVVGAGSLHPDSRKHYVGLSGSAGFAAEAPPALLELIKMRPVDLGGEGLKAAEDDTQAVGRYVEYLQNAEPAMQGHGGDVQTFKVACRGRDYGLTARTVADLMLEHYNPKCQPQWQPHELEIKVKNAYSYNKDVIGKFSPKIDFSKVIVDQNDLRWDLGATKKYKSMDDKGNIVEKESQPTILKTIRNIVNYFLIVDSPLHKCVGYNDFTGSVEFLKRAPWHTNTDTIGAWTDNDTIQLEYYLNQHKGVSFQNQMLGRAVLVASKYIRFHPVRSYLEDLKWDGVPRVDTWLTDFCGAAATDLNSVFGAKFLIGAVARIYKPGIKFDHMLVLEGAQGIGKSTVCDILGHYWFGDITLDPHNKDTVDAMRGKWILEIAEMECTRRAETAALKAFISRTVDRIRLPYGKFTQDFPRQCVLIGTINPEGDQTYLKDSTGNRRFWPVLCGTMNFEGVRKVRDQLWAEAVHRYKKGESIHIVDKSIHKQAMDAADERRSRDPWFDKIDAMLVNDENLKHVTILTAQEVWEQCLNGDSKSFDRYKAMRIATVMRDLGWERGTHRSKSLGKSVKGWKRPDEGIGL